MGSTQKRIILWCTPRSLSTAMCRVMMNSGYRTQVLSEPFSEAYYLGQERISTYYNVPDPDPSFTFTNALKLLKLPYSDKELVFAKLPVKQQEPDRLTSEWIPDGYMHTFLIRHPRKVAMSLAKILDADELEQWACGYESQTRMLEHIQQLGHRAVVFDADDVINHPEEMLRAYCREVGLEFCDSMVNWNPLSEEDQEAVFRTSRWDVHWFSNALTARKLGRSRRESSTDDSHASTLDPRKEDLIEKCVQDNIKYYEAMSALCIKP